MTIVLLTYRALIVMIYFIGSFEYRVTFLVEGVSTATGSGIFALLGSGSRANFQADRLYKSNDTYQYKCGLASGCCPSLKNA